MPGRYSHWSAAYLWAKAGVMWWQWRHPDAPWLTRDAVERMEAWLRPEHRVLEWGAGRSTGWFAKRAGSVVSIEHDATWHAKVARELRDAGLGNVDLRHEPEAGVGYRDPVDLREPFDLILVDGRRRGECALRAVASVAPGGWLVVDDAERYLPLRLRPDELPRTPPDLRGRSPQDCEPPWDRVVDATGGWRLVWTSDGVSDTALWQRPEEMA
jgi:hypothetical protein